jgi:hypothetical protein
MVVEPIEFLVRLFVTWLDEFSPSAPVFLDRCKDRIRFGRNYAGREC